MFHTVILIGACHLPGHLIPARRLLRANRRPMAAKLVKLTGHNRRPAIAQLNRRPAIRMKKIVVPNLNQAGRSKCLDHRLVEISFQPIKPRYSIGQPTARPAMGIGCLRQKSVLDAMRRE